MTVPRIAFIITTILIILVISFIYRKAKKDKRVISVSNAFTVLTGVLLVVFLFLIPYVFPNAINSTDVRIIEWDGYRSMDKLIMTATSCKDELETSNIYGTKPAYFIILSAKIVFTFANYGNVPDSLISVEIPDENSFAKSMTGLNLWYIFVSNPDEINTEIDLPIELPQRVPKKWMFQAFHAIETQPDISYSPVYDYFESTTPLVWTFKTLDGKQITHISEFLTLDSIEAVDDGKFEFTQDCKDIVPLWTFPALRTQINNLP